jgi:hypothetical protein
MSGDEPGFQSLFCQRTGAAFEAKIRLCLGVATQMVGDEALGSDCATQGIAESAWQQRRRRSRGGWGRRNEKRMIREAEE